MRCTVASPMPVPSKRLRRVEALEYAEQLVHVFHVKADSIVSNEHHDPILLLLRASDFDFRLGTRCA